MRLVGELAPDISSISSYRGKAPGPGVSDIATTASEVNDQLYSI